MRARNRRYKIKLNCPGLHQIRHIRRSHGLLSLSWFICRLRVAYGSTSGGNSDVQLEVTWPVFMVMGKKGTWIVTNASHYNDVIMNAMASQISSLTIVYSSVYSCGDQRKHQSSASLAFVRGIHQWRHHVLWPIIMCVDWIMTIPFVRTWMWLIRWFSAKP